MTSSTALDLISRKFKFFSQRLVGTFMACMFWMLQGDLRLVTPQHWFIGVKTALLSSTILLLISFIKIRSILRGFTSNLVLTSLVVAMVDHFVHPGHFGGEYTEAIATGLTAAALVIMSGIILSSIKNE